MSAPDHCEEAEKAENKGSSNLGCPLYHISVFGSYHTRNVNTNFAAPNCWLGSSWSSHPDVLRHNVKKCFLCSSPIMFIERWIHIGEYCDKVEIFFRYNPGCKILRLFTYWIWLQDSTKDFNCISIQFWSYVFSILLIRCCEQLL